MTTAQDLFKTFKGLSVKRYSFIQRYREVLLNLCRLERFESVTGYYRYYLKFDDGSMLTVHVDRKGNINMLEAYDPASTEIKK